MTPSTRRPTLDDHFVKLEDAPHRVGKSKHTIYRWIRERGVKVMRVNGEKWVSVPDLLRVERDTRR